MVGQNHCRNPFISCRVYSAGGSLHAAMVEWRSMILSPDDSIAHRGLSVANSTRCRFKLTHWMDFNRVLFLDEFRQSSNLGIRECMRPDGGFLHFTREKSFRNAVIGFGAEKKQFRVLRERAGTGFL